MAAAVRNGYTDIRSIKAAYANFQNQRQQTGNRFAEGGDTDNTYEPEVINPLDNLPEWKALENIDYIAIPDETFTKDKTGMGDIEYFNADYPKGTRYPNGYYREHPMPGRDVILYNPNTNDEQDVRLDALHVIRQRDPIYDALHANLTRAAKDQGGDIVGDAKYWQKVDRGVNQLRRVTDTALNPNINEEDYYVDTLNQYVDNEVDGFLRSLLMVGDSKYREGKGYIPNKSDLIRHNKDLTPYVNDIQRYLETGERPPYVLPDLEVTNQNAYGGNLFAYAGKMSKKQKPTYRYGTIEQALIEGSDGTGWFKVTSASRKPGEAGNAGKGSAHTYSLKDGSPAALDIVPNGIGWDEFFTILNTPKMKAALTKYGFDLLNETSAAMKKKTGATGNHIHVGRGIKGQTGEGVFYGGNMFGGGYKHLPREVNDMAQQVMSLQYNAPKAPIFTEEDQRLLDTPALAIVNPEYEDTQDPDYKPSALQESIKLDESLWRDPANNWALYNQFANMQQGSS